MNKPAAPVCKKICVMLLSLGCLLLSFAGSAQSVFKPGSLSFSPVALTGNPDTVPAPDRYPLEDNITLSATRINEIEGLLPDIDVQASLDEQTEAVEKYQQAIQSGELADGPYAAGIIEDLAQLGTLYQQQSEHELALAALERAQQISRINNGLYSTELIGLTETALHSLQALGRTEEAGQKHHYLLYLHEKTFGADNIAVAPALARLADWNLEVFRHRILQGKTSKRVMAQTNNPLAIEYEAQNAAITNLAAAQDYLIRAIKLLVKQAAFNDPQLQSLEKSLIQTYFLMAWRNELSQDPEAFLGNDYFTVRPLRLSDQLGKLQDYRNGENAYKRILQYQRYNPNTSIEQYAHTLINLGDWHLLFGKTSQGLDTYRQAYEALASTSTIPGTLDTLLHPEVPVALPEFGSSPGPAGRSLIGKAVQGFIDISFRLNRFGRATDIETLATSPDTSEDIQSELLWMVRDSQFRPRFEAGRPLEQDELTLRYYYSYRN